MELLQQNLPQTLMVAGIAALIIEVAVLGFATFILLFFGASLLITGFAMSLDLLPATATAALWSNTVLTAVLALALWKPLQRMQNKVQKDSIRSDFARQPFMLKEDVDGAGKTEYAYSGIRWKLKSFEPIAKGTMVEVIKVDVGVLWVKPLENAD